MLIKGKHGLHDEDLVSNSPPLHNTTTQKVNKNEIL
jgi:hypothetical protein